jgi:hypothetical protein
MQKRVADVQAREAAVEARESAVQDREFTVEEREFAVTDREFTVEERESTVDADKRWQDNLRELRTCDELSIDGTSFDVDAGSDCTPSVWESPVGYGGAMYAASQAATAKVADSLAAHKAAKYARDTVMLDAINGPPLSDTFGQQGAIIVEDDEIERLDEMSYEALVYVAIQAATARLADSLDAYNAAVDERREVMLLIIAGPPTSTSDSL